MRIGFIKGEREDRITVERAGQAAITFSFPKKGPTPHDAYHAFVERELGLRRGFWGLVAAGLEPGAVGAMASTGGHASATRAGPPSAEIIELIQAERLVESFEAESWGGTVSNAGIRALAASGWEASLVPPLDLPDATILAIRSGISQFAARWAAIGVGETVYVLWEEANG